MKADMRILITGGAGLVGSALVQRLQQIKFHEFLVVDNLLYEPDYLLNVPFKGGDVSDPKFILPILDTFKPDVVVHLAGIVGDGACAVRPLEAQHVNVDSIKLLCENYNGRIIFPSSCSVYGVNDDLVTEESPLNPLSLYASMKVTAEKLLKDKNAFIPRLGTLHGVGGRMRSDLVVNILTIRALIEKKMTVFGGEQYRPLLHVDDFVNTIIVQLPLSHQGIFNLVEDNYKIIDIANAVQKLIPGVSIEREDISFEDARNYRASSQKAKETWGFDPKKGLKDTIQGIINVYEDRRIKDFAHVKYSNLVSLQFKEENGRHS